MGGKERIANQIVELIQPYVKESYVEPFLGGASVCSRIVAKTKIAGDYNQALITMWQAVQNGWIPPTELSEDEYQNLKENKDPLDPMTAFVGFGCSFGGKWFGGYARDNQNSNYADIASRSILKKVKGMVDTKFVHSSYDEIPIPPNSLIYCDPPYRGTEEYGAVQSFDHDKFWQWVRDKQKEGHVVFVSEYSAPPDFKVAKEFKKKVTLSLNKDKYVDKGDKLFYHESFDMKIGVEELFHN